jgi:uncharacterized protein (TIRG00374 family)
MGRIEITLPNEKNNDWKRMLPGLIISAVSLIIIFYLIDFKQFFAALRLANYWLIAAAIALTLIWLLIRSGFWRTLLQEKATFSQVFFAINEGYLLNNILPFRLGEVGRSLILAGKANLNFLQVFSTVIIERVMDVGMAAGVLLITLPFVVGASWAQQVAFVVGLIVLAGLFMLFFVARYQNWFLDLFNRLTKRWQSFNQIGKEQITKFFTGLSVLTDPKQFFKAISWLLLNWLVAVFLYNFILQAYLPESKLLWGAFILGIASLGIAAPSSPGAVGVFELSVILGLSTFKVDHSTALAIAVTAHFINYLTTGILGALGFVKDGDAITDLYRQLRHLPTGKVE